MWNKYLGKKSVGDHAADDAVGAAPPPSGPAVTAAAAAPPAVPFAGATPSAAVVVAAAPPPSSAATAPVPVPASAPAIPAADIVQQQQQQQQHHVPTAVVPPPPLPRKRPLTAVLWPGGTRVTVRVVANGRIVGPPSGSDDDDMMMMRMMEHARGKQGIERSLSGSTSGTSNASNAHNAVDVGSREQQQQQRSHPGGVGGGDPTAYNGEYANSSNMNNGGYDDAEERDRRSVGGDDENPVDGSSSSSRENNNNGSSSSDAAAANPSFKSSSPADNNNNALSSSAASASSSAAESARGSTFEASLLLGIAEQSSSSHHSEKEKREPVDPATLPNSMTSFLDMLLEDQRRVRHRHIPGVDGFRKLYRSEVKADMSEARRTKRTAQQQQQRSSRAAQVVDDDARADSEKKSDAQGEGKDDDGERPSATSTSGAGDDHDDDDDGVEEEEDGPEYRDAFLAPGKEARSRAMGGWPAGALASNDFERGVVSPTQTGGGGGPGTSSSSSATSNNVPNAASSSRRPDPERSPRLVDSLASFDPPRPRESTSSKTRHRLRRWEANPSEVESDLANYRRTVARTREELNNAGAERALIEAGASLVRGHFAEHLERYARETRAAREEMARTRRECLRLEERYGGGRATGGSSGASSTRGGARGMRDALVVLKKLGEDVKGVDNANDVNGGGGGDGRRAVPNDDWRTEGVGGVASNASGKNPVASGWILKGDEVVVRPSGEEGTVEYVRGPEEERSKAGSKAGERKTETKRKNPPPAIKGEDAMDVDAPSAAAPADGEDSPVLPAAVGVRFSDSRVREHPPSDVSFDRRRHHRELPRADADIVRRWEAVIETALGCGVDHDLLAMEERVRASLLAEERRTEEEEEDAKKDDDDHGKKENDGGGNSPRSVLPFGAGLIAAPACVRDYPSLIPLDSLEESVRRVVYETDKPRVIPSMSEDVRKFEAQREETNRLKGKVMQLRNRLGRQKRLRGLNERGLLAGKHRADKVEGLLLEMQMDLRSLKGRLRDELNEIGIGNSPETPFASEKCADDRADDDEDDVAGASETGGVSKEEGGSPNEAGDVPKEEGAKPVIAADTGDDVLADAEGPDPGEGGECASSVPKPFPESEGEASGNVPPGTNEGTNEGADEELEREVKRARMEEV